MGANQSSGSLHETIFISKEEMDRVEQIVVDGENIDEEGNIKGMVSKINVLYKNQPASGPSLSSGPFLRH